MKKIITTCLVVAAILPAIAQKYEWKQNAVAGYTYRYVTKDPIKARFYTLKNGLTVILSVNHKEPRIAVRIAVRTGSNNDPKEHTGLAHYLEHLLFKGTSAYGSLDWTAEKPQLDRIDNLYEKYNHSTEAIARASIYHQIDSVSGVASRFAIANEYDKLMSDIGSQGTNAHTSVEETVYEEDIPSPAIDKFLAVQAERFRDPVFRLFHTELEAVYEEKNRGLDNDGSKMFEAMNAAIFPTHNYGQQTTIGTVEHLKNPSILAIRAYYHTYYVPGNIAIIMSGDFNPDELIKKIDNAFSYMKQQSSDEYHPAAEKPLTAPIEKNIYGPSAENMRLAFRTPAAGTRDALVLDLASSILSNGKAGLLDLDLNKHQLVQSSGAGLLQYKDYGIFILNGTPKQGQSLEDMKHILLSELRKLISGSFDVSLVKAIIANSRLAEIQGWESNGSRVGALTDAFIKHKGAKWNNDVSSDDEQEKITRKEIMSVAAKYLGNGYAVLYKRKGEDDNIVKVEKPLITPVETNAGKQSAFVKKIEAMPAADVQPVWLDFKRDIARGAVGSAQMLYTQNRDNELFRQYYRFDMGAWNSKLLPLAASYLQFLGTDKYSSEEISKAYYEIACNFNISVGTEYTNVIISGLQQNFEKAVGLFESLISRCQPNDSALASLKDRIFKSRSNAKLDKQNLVRGLIAFARYGEKNPFNNVLNDQEIRDVKADDLVNILHELFHYRHTVIYFGPKSLVDITKTITDIHWTPSTYIDYPPKKSFQYKDARSNEVLFADYDMVQSEIYWVRNGKMFDINSQPSVDVFNNYFGGGMGSVVFQTIRESKALAYSTFAQLATPANKDERLYEIAYVGCQADKMNEAVRGMNALLDTMPVSANAFILAKTTIKKDINTERITGDGIIFSYLGEKQKGIDYDFRKWEYEAIDNVTIQDLQDVHQRELAGKPYTYCIVGSEKKISADDLARIGNIRKLSLEDIFGY